MKQVEIARREPVQARSRARVQRILDAAAALVRTRGMDAVTVREIATLAEVSTATIYQFFPNRDAILQYLMVRNFERLDARLKETLEGAAFPTLEAAIGAFTTAHEAHYGSDLRIVELFYGSPLPSMLAEDNREHHRRLAEILRSTLLGNGFVRSDTPERVFDVAIEVGSRLFEMACRGGTIDRAVITEGELLVVSYLRHYA